MIQLIEEISMNALPALETALYDGWVLRFAGGYTRRANSVYPLYPGNLPIEEKIAACEELYRKRGLPVMFKLTAASLPEGLDGVLASRGYRPEAATLVQRLRLHQRPWAVSPEVALAGELPDAWFMALARLNDLSQQNQAMLRRMLVGALPQMCFASIAVDGAIVTCGLGVLLRGHLGLYDIVTDPAHRRQGFARRLVESLLAWGRQHGAHTAYLQVMVQNAAALKLYAALGFSDLYRYWYRVKQE
jgi:ribosomal protein S18 acetylase RimI-like enzyme